MKEIVVQYLFILVKNPPNPVNSRCVWPTVDLNGGPDQKVNGVQSKRD